EIRNPQQSPTPDQLEPLEFELQRYMKHVHVGPYQALPKKWKDLKAELVARGEVIGAPSLEVYGHHCDEPSKLETPILIDLQAEPINRAKQKAAERGLTTTFVVMDALMLKDWSERFDNLIDSGLFHVFNDDDRRHYVEGLAAVLKPGGRLFLLCFSDEEP